MVHHVAATYMYQLLLVLVLVLAVTNTVFGQQPIMAPTLPAGSNPLVTPKPESQQGTQAPTAAVITPDGPETATTTTTTSSSSADHDGSQFPLVRRYDQWLYPGETMLRQTRVRLLQELLEIGYYTFNDPCMIMESIQIEDLDLQSSSTENSAVLGLVEAFTGGTADQLVPTHVEITFSLIMEVNNTNPFDLKYYDYYETNNIAEGKIFIAGNNATGGSLDVEIAVWRIDPQQQQGTPATTATTTTTTTTFNKMSVNLIPLRITAVVDLLAYPELAPNFISGGPMGFRITGVIQQVGWIKTAESPGENKNTFDCWVLMANVLNVVGQPTTHCRHSSVDDDDGFDMTVLLDPDSKKLVDPSCYV